MREWYQYKNYWLRESKKGEKDRYGFAPEGLGDLIFNTMTEIIKRKDKSKWAYDSLVDCACLLLTNRRWPDEFQEKYKQFIAKTKIGHKISKRLFKLGIRSTMKYRSQSSMTRDPFIAFYTVCVFLDRKQFIEAVPMPWGNYSPEIWRWRKRLIKDNRAEYKRRLRWLRAKAIVLNQPEFE